ncbi:MAG TPA: LysE family transporter [Promineifilum sp.]|nr:LysE family transporter [Promineifilum sp.]HQF70365.1 LysE family transporter [Promineifilum sp.]
MLPYLLRGLILGGTAAAQPGPFQAFLLSLVARDGWRRALPAVLAPLVSDPPIVALVLVVLTRLPERWLAVLQVAGGVFLFYLGWGAWRAFRTWTAGDTASAPARGSNLAAILKAAVMNALSPGPYLFWATISGPILVAGWRERPVLGLAFLLGFYAALIGGMVLFVLVVGLTGRIGPRLNRALAAFAVVALFGFGLYQFVTGVRALVEA